jgi:hypothetical protein
MNEVKSSFSVKGEVTTGSGGSQEDEEDEED